MSAEIVPLRGTPEQPQISLQDIPAQLRQLAERIEAGEFDVVGTLFCVMPLTGDYPNVFGWGNVDGTNDPAIQLELARMWLLTNMVTR